MTPFRPRLLVVTTSWWPSDVKLATSLRDAGCAVSMLCPRGHPARSTRLDAIFTQRAFRRQRALADAIRRSAPDMVVPTDERALRDLHRLHRTGAVAERQLVERSLGPADRYAEITSRDRTMRAARAAGLATADTIEAVSLDALASWSGGSPLVLKSDGSSGGHGVRTVSGPASLEAAWRSLTRPPHLLAGLKRWLVNRDPFPLADRLAVGTPPIVGQRWVGGTPGDLAMFCCGGEVLGAAIAVSEQSARANGPSTMVRLVERPELLDGARRLAKQLRLSGFIGLDFIVDDITGNAVVIEINPRATPLGGSATGAATPVAAAARSLGALPGLAPGDSGDLIAYFPAAWRVDPDDERLALCVRDVPADDPPLLAELLRTPWVERGALAVAFASVSTLLTGRARTHDLSAAVLARHAAKARGRQSEPGLQSAGPLEREAILASTNGQDLRPDRADRAADGPASGPEMTAPARHRSRSSAR